MMSSIASRLENDPHRFTHAQMLPAQSDYTTLAHWQLAQVYNIGVFRSSSVRISSGLIESDGFVEWTCSWFSILRE